ncbi:hypothetical protein RUM43_008105 [Polyplax serrata]|uniref:Uncharacterized protein n=1 Tax=Polyplax serrata TaxID=468196 RepID=A0AAN8PA28_POLSC
MLKCQPQHLNLLDCVARSSPDTRIPVSDAVNRKTIGNDGGFMARTTRNQRLKARRSGRRKDGRDSILRPSTTSHPPPFDYLSAIFRTLPYLLVNHPSYLSPAGRSDRHTDRGAVANPKGSDTRHTTLGGTSTTVHSRLTTVTEQSQSSNGTVTADTSHLIETENVNLTETEMSKLAAGPPLW